MSLLYPDEPSPLSGAQVTRAEALLAARAALAESKGGPFTRGTGPADALDLYSLAVYIETGGDPWAPARPQLAEQPLCDTTTDEEGN